MRNALYWVGLTLVSVVFFSAGTLKLLDVAAFQDVVRLTVIQSWPLSALIALWLPVAECLSVLFLWFPKWRMLALAHLGLMAVAFLGFVAQAWARGLDISCGCFGKGLSYPLGFGVFIDAVLVLVLVVLSIRTRSRSRLSS